MIDALKENQGPTSYREVLKLAKKHGQRDRADYMKVGKTANSNTWRVLEDFILGITPWGSMGSYEAFVTDLATVVLNLWDSVPCVIHDILYVHRINLQGEELTRKQCDLVFLYLNLTSWNRANRALARGRYAGLRAYEKLPEWVKNLRGGDLWNNRTATFNGGEPVPERGKAIYQVRPFNNEERSAA